MADDAIAIVATLEVDGESLRVQRLSIDEAVFAVPRLVAEVVAEDGSVPSPDKLVGKPLDATLLPEKGGDTRVFHGTVVSARRHDDAASPMRLILEASPSVWRLGKRRDCRVFQDKSTVDIACEVLDGAGITARVQLTGSYEPRTYVTQYRETDLEFLERLLSEEGIYFFVEYEAGSDAVVLCDEPSGCGEVQGPKVLPFEPGFGFDTFRPWVRSLTQALCVRPDKTHLRQYDFERPRYVLEGKAEGTDDGEHALEVYEYPGRFLDDATASRRAQSLADALQSERNVVRGDTAVLYLTPARHFEIEGHPYAPLNGEHVLLSISITYSDPRTFRERGEDGANYACQFTAIPSAKCKLTPPRRPRATAIAGMHSAVVTGPSGQEIHSDEHGRVKAQYFWDRLGAPDDTSSLWMRTSQLPIGNSMLLPRVGWEVVVQHDEGDPDTPLVMSRLYNAVTPPPYALPDGKARSALQTATTPGGGSVNELRTDDTKGKEEMFLNASKDMTVDVLNNTTESVGNNVTRSIGSNRALSVTNSADLSVGASQTLDVGGNQSIKIETFKTDECGGDHSLTIGGNRDMKVGGDHRRTVGATSSVTVGGNHTDLVVGSVSESTLADMKIDVGAARVAMTAADHATTVGGSHSETVGGVKLIVAFGGRGVEVGAAMNHQVGGAILTKIDGDRADSAGATFTETAAGARIIKANNVTYEAKAMISLVMGASTVIITPASISIAGTSIKLDGATKETAALVVDN